MTGRRDSRPLTRVGRLILAWSLAASFWFAQVGQATPLLRPAAPMLSAEKRQQLEDDPHVPRWREARMAVAGMFEPSAWNEPLTLNLFPNAELEAHVRSARTLGSGSQFLSGTLAGGGRFTLLRNMAGILRGEFHTGRDVFTMRSLGPRRVLVKQLDLSELSRCATMSRWGRRTGLTAKVSATAQVPQPRSRPPANADHEADSNPTDVLDVESTAQVTAKSSFMLSEENTGSPAEVTPDETVDVLVVYTPNAERREGGREEIEATIEAEMEKTNQALANSRLDHRRIRLAGMKKVEYIESTEHIGDDLSYLYSIKDNPYDPEGVLDEVFDLRKRYAADIVHLLVEQSRQHCGIASIYTLYEERKAQNFCSDKSDVNSCMQRRRKAQFRHQTFSTSAIEEGCRALNTFSHELGHNFGVYHERYDETLRLTDPVHFPYKPYGFGYVNQNFSRSKCSHTIMAYGSQCVDEGYSFVVEELMFSNHDVQLGSEEVGYDPAGVEGEEWTTDLGGPVNASRAIDEGWTTVANLYHSSTVGSDRLFSGEAELLSADDAALDLSDYFDAVRARRYSATVDNPDLANVSVVGSILTVTANEEGEDGIVTVTATSTDETGQTETLRFEVTISPPTPGGWRGWRATLATPPSGA